MRSPTPLPPKKVSVAIENKPWAGVTGFHTDAALESFNVQNNGEGHQQRIVAPVAGGPSSGPEPDTSIIYKKNDAYHVYFHITELVSDWGTNLASFTTWLSSLQETDVVYFNQTGSTDRLVLIVQILGAFATECKAKKIFVVDHPIENALLAVVCDDIMFTSTGSIKFTNNLNIDRNRWDLIYTPYLKSLFAKAVAKGLLTEAEATAVIDDNAIIYKTHKEMVAAGLIS